jgi:alkaline phosphatase
MRSWTTRLTILAIAFTVLAPSASDAAAPQRFKNVIVLMYDGAGSTHTTVTRWYKGAPLALDDMYLTAFRTYGADSIITDSAPAATAFACGVKASDKALGVMPDNVTVPGVPVPTDETRGRPVASVLEAARLTGRSTGLVSTSNVQHASPAAYSAHWPDRGNYNEICEQQVYQSIDVVLGAGKPWLLPTTASGGKRTDGENLVEVLKARGYAFVEDRAALQAFNGKRVWGMFADGDMRYEMDRTAFSPNQPSLAEMTSKAIDVLSQNPEGFFLFVEGSKVDWASHANDPIGVISDMLAYDAAVEAALDFAKANGNTLVLCMADHGNGGMTIGNKKTDATYSKLPLSALVDPLRKATITGEGVELFLAGDKTEAKIKEALDKYGISDPTAVEIAAVAATPAGSMNYTVGPMLSSRSSIGWTTGGHTGEDLFLFFWGLSEPLGLVENTTIAAICAEALGIDLPEITAALFTPESEFVARGATVKVDRTDVNNPVFIAEKGFAKIEIPLSTNVMKVYYAGVLSETRSLRGIAVQAPKTGKVYVPRQALGPFDWRNGLSAAPLG